ncbi:MAG TPA: hypothetical protein VLD67_12170, partial [Vicinamibacterales bacterium]|nr:hypothetical protein [Vicinamibacterales bacterium]
MQSARTRVPALLAALIVLGLDAAGQTSQQREPFRAGVDLITVDFMAMTQDGTPVADLRPEDLTLKVNGRDREVKSFQFVRVADARPVKGDAAPYRELPQPFGTNYVGDAGRAVILIVENESLRPSVTRHTTDAAAQFVNDLSPRDRVALVTMPRGGLQTDLTRDHARVRELLASVSGQGSERTSGSEHACRSRDTLSALTGLLEGLASIDLPKSVVFISAGILTPRRDAPANAPPGQCEIRPVY